MLQLQKGHNLLALILLVAFLVRLYRIDYPLLDWHSWRQADTASVTKEYVKHGIDLLHPTYHDLSNIPSGLDNAVHGYRMVEFPFVNATVALILRAFPQLQLVAVSRFVSIIFSLATIAVLYALVHELWGKKVALLTALSYALIPYIVYYSRVVLPEPAFVFFSTSAVASFYFWLRSKRVSWYFVAIASLSSALLLKPFALFLAPLFLALYLDVRGWRFWRNTPFSEFIMLSIFPVISILPLWQWREWIAQFPEGIPASDWLFNGNGIRFRPAWFRWLGYERFTKLIWGYIGIALPFFGLYQLAHVIRSQRHALIFFSWWLSIGVYLSVIATGNVQHDYYQVIASPIVAVTTGLGIMGLYTLVHKTLKKHKLKVNTSKQIAFMGTTIFCFAMVWLAWGQVKGYFNVNHWEYVNAGDIVDKYTPADAKVIAPAYGDTAFLFQTNRRGWPIGFDIDKKIEAGATHYITTAFDDEAKQLMQKYKIVLQTSDFLLLDLTQEQKP